MLLPAIRALLERISDFLLPEPTPTPTLKHLDWPEPRPDPPLVTASFTANRPGTLHLYCSLCGDCYTSPDGRLSGPCPPCRRAQKIKQESRQATWRMERDALLLEGDDAES